MPLDVCICDKMISNINFYFCFVFLKIQFSFCVCGFVCSSEHSVHSAQGDQKMELDSLKIRLQITVSWQTWVLEAELQSSAKALCAPNYTSTSPTAWVSFKMSGSYFVAQTGLQILIFLPHSIKFCNCRHEPLCLSQS